MMCDVMCDVWQYNTYSIDRNLIWVNTTKSAHMNGHWKAYDEPFPFPAHERDLSRESFCDNPFCIIFSGENL